MKSKRLIQILIVFILMFSTIGGSQSALASSNSLAQLDVMVINRNLNLWDATYIGFVNSSIHENWHFDFTETHNFVVTVSPVSGELVPLLILMDVNGNELAHGTGTLTSTQPVGNYSIQIQPVSGSGFYILTFREVITSQASVTTVVTPASVNVGETALVIVSLNNVPAEGYTSAEFTCTCDANLVEAGNIVVSGLFGADAAAAINGPQDGSFIVAIAGSNGNKATTSGVAFTFSAKGLQAGQSPIECEVSVSKADNVLTQLPSTGTSLTVTGSTSTPTATPLESPTPTATSTPIESATPTASSTPVETFTPTASSTPIASPTPTFTSTPIETPTATTVPPTSGTLTGHRESVQCGQLPGGICDRQWQWDIQHLGSSWDL